MASLRNAKELLDVAKELSNWIRGEKDDALVLDCLNGLGVYSTTVLVSNPFARWAQSLGPRSREFSADSVYDVKVTSFKPTLGRIPDAVRVEGGKFIVDLTKTLGLDMFRLEVLYRFDSEWLKTLVHSRSSPEPLTDRMRYHLSAQLTDPASLSAGFREVDVNDYPVKASVHVQEPISTALPVLNTIKRMRKIEEELLAEYNPRQAVKVIRLQRERHTLHQKLQRENPGQVLQELLLILGPSRFLGYLQAEQDFRLHECGWGTDVFRELGAVALPATMEVITRAELTLDRPAAKGLLNYESGRFLKDLEGVIKKRETRARRQDATE